MNSDDIKSIIREIFLGNDRTVKIEDQLDLVAAGICDSFALLELATAIEGRLEGIVIPDSDITVANFGSVERVLAYLKDHHSG